MGRLPPVMGLLFSASLLLWTACAGSTGGVRIDEPSVQLPYPTPTAAVTPAPAFGNGVHVVGASGIAPGIYRSSGQQGECYWARLSGHPGDYDVLASDRVGEHNAVVALLPTDAGLESRGCAPWETVIPPEVGSHYTTYSAKVSDGLHIVGDDVAPATYHADNAQGSCRWARLASLSQPDDIIESETGIVGNAVVTIAVTDAGFESSGCGEWLSQGFNNCQEMQAVFSYHEGVHRGHPVYKPELDGDGDGIACETEN